MQELEKILEEIDLVKEEIVNLDCGDDYNAGLRDMAMMAKQIIRKHMNDGWILVNDRLPEERINPVSQDFYEYQVTAKFGNVKDVRHYKYGNGHWRHGPGIVDKYVIAWRPLPKPYRPERSNNHDK